MGVREPTTAPDGVWSPGRRALTVGLVFTVTLVGFEGLAIATILKVIEDDLHDVGLLGWVFSAFFLGSIFGVVAAGYDADRHGPARPYVVGLVLFATGLLAGGLAPNMGVLVAARAVQGVGAGALPAIAYVAIGRSVSQGAAAPHVRRPLERMGAARIDRAGDQRRRSRSVRLAVGVPRTPAVGRARGGHDDAAPCSPSAHRAETSLPTTGSRR